MPMQNAPAAAPTTGTTEMNALTNNPNGSDWLAKFNRPNVRSQNYLGTTHPRCHYVMEGGTRTKVCK